MNKILLAEDDLDLGTILIQFLELNKYSVLWAKDGVEALKIIENNSVDLCILDVMMPKMDGFSLAKSIVDLYPEILFFFLTAKTDIKDKIKGLKLGADDYITKPFDTQELLLRIQNVLNRSSKSISELDDVKVEKILNIGKYIFNTEKFTLDFNGNTVRVTEKEGLLISYFYKNKNMVCKRDDILNEVWGTDDYFTGRSMDVFISRLRKYFKGDSNISINSLRAIGFEFILI